MHAVAFSKKLRWLAQAKVITLKTQTHAENACRNAALLDCGKTVPRKKFTPLQSPRFFVTFCRQKL